MNDEDDIIPRICVSKSINGCLTGTQCYGLGDIVNIYKCESNNVIQPSIEQVPNVCFSGEEWILEPVIMQLFMQVKILSVINCHINDNKMYNKLYQFEIQY